MLSYKKYLHPSKTLIAFSLIVLLLNIWIFKSWFLSPAISAGDFWYYFKSMFDNFSLYPYAWYATGTLGGLGGQGFAYQNGVILSAVAVGIAKLFNISWESSSRFFFYIPYIFLSFASSAFLVRRIFPNNRFWLFSPIIFSLNTYILMTLGGGQLPTALSYALMPFTVFSFVKLADKVGSQKSNIVWGIIICSLLLGAQTLLDLRIAFVTSVAIVLYLLLETWIKGLRVGIKILIIYACSFLVLGLINFYWLTSVLLYGIDPIKNLGADYNSSNIVKFLSFARMENSISLLHPYFPDNVFGKIGFMKAEFLLLPIISFASLLFIKKNNVKHIIFFSMIGLLGIFLGKGSSEPLGFIYTWLFEHIPGFQLFRDSFKWFVLVALSFSMLIPYALDNISGLIEAKFKTKYAFHIILVTFLVYFLFLIKPAVLGQIAGTFKTRTVPSDYVALDRFLVKNPGFFRTLWIPTTVLFGHYTNIQPQISARDFFQEYDQKRLLKQLSSGKNILSLASVKYVVIPSDTEKEIFLADRKYDDNKYQSVVQNLDKIPWLIKEKTFGRVVVYKTGTYKDHFWCDCSAQVSYQFVNPTRYKVVVSNLRRGDRLIFSESYDKKWVAQGPAFQVESSQFGKKFNSFLLPEGSYSFEVFYYPQKFVDMGFIVSLLTLIGTFAVLFWFLLLKMLE